MAVALYDAPESLPLSRISARPSAISGHSTAAEVASIFGVSGSSVAASTRLEETARNPSEAALWFLATQLLSDAERNPLYRPEAIPVVPHPTRLWHVSLGALTQWAVQSSRTLRVINTVLLWLEQCESSARAAGPRRLRVGTARTPNDAALLREAVVDALRAGECEAALSLAEHARDGPLCVVLRLSRLIASEEPWQRQVPMVPLFGEYGHSIAASQWVSSGYRGDMMSDLYNEAEARASSDGLHETRGGDALVAAIFSGHRGVLERVFSRTWQDALWAILRSGAIQIFIRASRQPLSSPSLEASVERLCGNGGDDWVETAARRIAHDARVRLRQALDTASPIEQLQIHLLRQALTPDDGAAEGGEGWVPPSGDDPVPCASLFLLLSLAYREGIWGADPQASPTTFAAVLRAYVAAVVHAPLADVGATMRRVVSIVDVCRDAATRVGLVHAMVRHLRLRQSAHVAGNVDVMAFEVGLLQIVAENEAARGNDDARAALIEGLSEGMPFLVTHCPLSEALLWRAALRRPSEPSLLPVAFETLGNVWLEEHEAHCSTDAIRVTLSFIANHTTLTEDDVGRLALWESVAIVRLKAVQHAATTARFHTTRDDDTARAEVQLRETLRSHAERIVRLFLTDRRAGVSVAAYAVVAFADACTLGMRTRHAMVRPDDVLLSAMDLVRLARSEGLISRVTPRQAEEMMAAAVRVRAAFGSCANPPQPQG